MLLIVAKWSSILLISWPKLVNATPCNLVTSYSLPEETLYDLALSCCSQALIIVQFFFRFLFRFQFQFQLRKRPPGPVPVPCDVTSRLILRTSTCACASLLHPYMANVATATAAPMPVKMLTPPAVQASTAVTLVTNVARFRPMPTNWQWLVRDGIDGWLLMQACRK